MHRQFQNSVLIVVVLWICCATLPAAEEVTEKYPDGAKKAVYSVNAAGMKHGNYDEFFSNGKRKIQARYVNGKLYGPYKSFFENGRNHIRAAYKADELTGKYSEYAEQGGIARSAIYGEGKLDGPYQEFTKGVLVKDQSFLKGRLLVPKSAKLITATLGAISTMRIQTVGEIPANANRKYQAALADPLLQKEREDALRTLMAYRYLCDVPFQDLVLDRSFIVCTEAGCDLLQRVGSLQHTPPNPGVAAEDYKLGFSGTKSSNLHIGQKSMTDAVRGFMDDSDPGNIDRLGHRRWCLNPKMAKTAFARQGKFSAMWAVDESRSKVLNYEFVAFLHLDLRPLSCSRKTGLGMSL